MFKNVLETIAGVEIYPIISLFVFVTIFTIMLVWVVRRKKSYLDRMARLPLDEDLPTTKL